jgi:hypothetical protein
MLQLKAELKRWDLSQVGRKKEMKDLAARLEGGFGWC